MKKLALGLVLVSGIAFGQVKKVVSSDVHWWGYKVAKSKASSHDGTVNVQSGSITMKGKSIVGGQFVLDMTSINATDVQGEGQRKLNAHLKNGDFFEVDKYPTAVYKITSVKKNSGNKTYNFLVNGTLTAKGKTSPVSFPASIVVAKDGSLTLTSDKFSFDRQKHDITYGSMLTDSVIKDDVDMTVKVVAK